MATFSDMVDEVKTNLAGYTLRQDRITYLANAGGISTSATTITVGSSSNLAKGIVEVEDELILIDSFDKSANTLNVMPGFGRGYQHSTVATHAQYSPVILSPSFPRITIKQAINDTINSVFPKLWKNAVTTFAFNPAQTTYQLPSNCEDVTQVTWEAIGPSKEWIPVKRWRADQMANTTSFASGQTVSIYDAITPGRTVQVYYKAMPSNLSANSDEFVATTGLPATARDVITLGAASKMLSFIDAGRINLTSAEADSADSKIPSTAAATNSKYIYALFQQRLNEENARLLGQHPTTPHYTR